MPEALDPLDLKIVFFDGYCNLCNASVDYFIRHNKTKNLYFSSLQGQQAKALGLEEDLESFIFWDQGKVYKYSTAVFELIPYIQSFGASILFPFKYIPRRISDFVYKQVAKSRYSIFGKKEVCRVASGEEKGRFLA